MERERAGSKALIMIADYLIPVSWIMVRLGYFIFIVLQYSNSTEATYPAVFFSALVENSRDLDGIRS